MLIAVAMIATGGRWFLGEIGGDGEREELWDVLGRRKITFFDWMFF